MRTLTFLALMSICTLSDLVVHSCHGVILFSENFEEGNLDKWTGVGGGSHSGEIVLDPLQGDNALTHTATTAGGDTFTIDSFSHPSGLNFLEFDYLGLPGQGGVAGDLGGFIGHYDGVTFRWLAGTRPGDTATGIDLPVEGQWTHIVIPYVAASHQLMMEDFSSSLGVAGDFLFDNIVIHGGAIEQLVPEPSTISLSALALLSLGFVGWRRRRHDA